MLRHNPLVTFQNPPRGGGDDNVIGRGGRFVLRNETWYLVLVLLLCLVSPTSEFVLFLFFFLVFFDNFAELNWRQLNLPCPFI